MNSVSLIGRLTRDPDIRYGAASQMAVARFTIAIDRVAKDKDGNKQTDFPSIVAFGKTAEQVEKYVTKGMLVGVTGRIQTGSYKDKDGKTVYTTDVVADRVEFLDRGGRSESNGGSYNNASASDRSFSDDVPGGFTKMTDDDIPF